MASYDGIFFDSGGTIFGAKPSGPKPSGPKPSGGAPSPGQVGAQAPERLAAALKWLGHAVSEAEVRQQLETERSQPRPAAYTEENRVRAVFEGLGLAAGDDEIVYATGVYSGPRYRSWVFPGAAAAMGQLAEAGLAMGLIANTHVPGWVMDRHFRGIGLLHHLPVRVYSGDEGVAKPDPGIFHLAAERAGLEGKRLAYMGDRVDKDVAGAAAAGWTSILFRSALDTSDGAADFEIDAWDELPAILGAA